MTSISHVQYSTIVTFVYYDLHGVYIMFSSTNRAFTQHDLQATLVIWMEYKTALQYGNMYKHRAYNRVHP